MKISIITRAQYKIPKITLADFVKKLWEKGETFTKSGNSIYINQCKKMTYSWNKAVDMKNNKGLSERPAVSIIVDFIRANKITIEMTDDNAPIVDIRAFAKTVSFFCRIMFGSIILDTGKTITPDEFEEEYSKYLLLSFDEALSRR